MLKKLIINADDFGLSPGVNQGIIKAMTEGIVTSTTIMMNREYAQDAIRLSKEYDVKGIGIHLTISSGRPLLELDEVSSLVNEDGNFDKRMYFSKEKIGKQELKEIELEYRAQIEEFLKSGLEITHLDSHHHAHSFPKIRDLAVKLAKEYQLPLRFVNKELKQLITENQLLSSDYFSTEFYAEGVSIDNLKELITQMPEGLIEFMVHPAEVDQELIEASSYNQIRAKELEILTSDKMKKWINEQNIELVDFSVLK